METSIVSKKKRWTEEEEQKAIELLKSGQSYREISDIMGRTAYSISRKNFHDWKIDASKINLIEKVTRGTRLFSYKISDAKKGCWAGEKNPNYGAKIVKRGSENPLSIWKRENPGYQDGENNPSYGRIQSPEEIEKKTRKMVELAHYRKGKTYEEVYGEEKTTKIGLAMSAGAVQRLSKQKTSVLFILKS